MAQEALNFAVNPNDVTDDLILRKCKSLRSALRFCRDCSPLTDKEIIDEIRKRTGYEYQHSHFTEALNGGRKNIDPDHIPVLEDICNNAIPTRYLTLIRNCEMKPKKEVYEMAFERERAEREKIQLKYETLMEVISVKR